MQPQVAEFLAQGLPGDPQQAGGLVLIPTGVLQDAGQQLPVHLPMCLRVQIAGIGAKLLADGNRFHSGFFPKLTRFASNR